MNTYYTLCCCKNKLYSLSCVTEFTKRTELHDDGSTTPLTAVRDIQQSGATKKQRWLGLRKSSQLGLFATADNESRYVY